jgi:hypothetical protein
MVFCGYLSHFLAFADPHARLGGDERLDASPGQVPCWGLPVEGKRFEFKGYRFEEGQRLVRKKSLKSLRYKIRIKTKRNVGSSIDFVIASLNPTPQVLVDRRICSPLFASAVASAEASIWLRAMIARS